MRELTLPEHTGHTNLAALIQKLQCVPNEMREIVLCDARRYLYTLYLLLRLLLILARLGFEVFVLAKIDDLGDRGLARRSDQN